MASLDSLKVRKLLGENKVVRLADGEGVAIRIAYTGTSTTAPVISVITATSLTLTTSLGATVFTFSTFTTVALLAAAIGRGIGDGGLSAAGGGFACRILDALPTQSTETDELAVSAGLVGHTVNGETVYDVMLDDTKSFATSGLAYRVAYDRNVNLRKAVGGHRVSLSGFVYNCNVNGVLAGAIKIYEMDLNGSTNLIWAATSVDSTGAAGATTLDFSAAPLTAAEGNELIVCITDATSITASAQNYLQVSFTRE